MCRPPEACASVCSCIAQLVGEAAAGCTDQPTPICGPETPRPSMCRPPERCSSVSACIAQLVGVRAEFCTTDVPSRTRSVDEPHHASGVNASDPHDSAAKTASNPSASAADTSSCAFGGGCAPQYPSCSPSFIARLSGRMNRHAVLFTRYSCQQH